MAGSSSTGRHFLSSARSWIGAGLAVTGVVLGILAALGGAGVGGSLVCLALSAVGGALIWIAKGRDDRAIGRRKRVAGIAALGAAGALFGSVGLAMRASGEQDGTFLALGGAAAGAAAAVWWMATRNTRVPDLVHGPIELGDGRSEIGTTVMMPRSKRLALFTGALLTALIFIAVAPAMLDDGDQRGWLLGALGILVTVVGGPPLALAAFHHAYLAVSGTGVTIRFRGSHYTVPWKAVERAGIYEFTTYHRGIKHTHRQLGIAADHDHAIGTLRKRDLRAAGRSLAASGWAVTFPQTVFDLHIEDVATLVNEARTTATPTDLDPDSG